jgi:hypothetical protein
MPAVRWDEQNPGCTYSRDSDGKYRFGLWWDDVAVVLAVDAQEANADALNDQVAREVKKHPERQEQEDVYVRAYLKDSAELIEFVGKSSLRQARLSPSQSEASGWVFFSTESKWISKWKKQEELILRVPLKGVMFEFPFKLPPKPGETILRKRN